MVHDITLAVSVKGQSIAYRSKTDACRVMSCVKPIRGRRGLRGCYVTSYRGVQFYN